MEENSSGFWIFLAIVLIIATFWFSNQNNKLKDQIEALQKQITTYEKSISSTNCTKSWSVSQKKYVDTCKSKLETLSDCSKNSREKLVESATSLKSVGDLEKLRELLMKMCMQENGFDY